MKLITFLIFMFSFHAANSFSIFDDQDEYIEECEKLLEQVEKSNCGKQTLVFLRDAYIKVGVDVSQHSIVFEHKDSQQAAFNMKGKWTPSPVLSFSLGDSYFGESSAGYQLGLTYIADTAYEQQIERDKQSKDADLLTYTKTTVYAFTPSLFYRFGHQDDTPHSSFTLGLGLNLGYSLIKGTAYLTELKDNSNCYDAGTQYVNGAGTISSITSQCPFTDYESDGFSTGANLYMSYEFRRWLLSISSGIYTQELRGDYHFSTYDLTFSLARTFGF